MLRLVLVVAVLVAAAPARADLAAAALARKAEIPVKRCKAPFPPGVAYTGGARDCWTFTDKNGDNYVLFSETRTSRQVADETEETASLYVDHFVALPGKARVLRKVRDQERCIFDLTATFDDNGFHVTDLDKDGIAEVTFAYQIGCRSDVSANTLKVLLLEGGTKYILRGKTRIKEGGEPDTGHYTVDPSFNKGPAVFLRFAEKVWEDVVDDAEIGPERAD